MRGAMGTGGLRILRRQVFQPLHGVVSGSPRLPYLRKIEKTQYLPEERLRAIQWERLQELLYYAWEHNGFYRDRFEKSGLSPDSIRVPEDFRRLPVLNKDEIRRAGLGMLSNGFDTKTLLRAKTGGSTGTSLELFFTEECSELRNACAWRHDRWTGWNPGEPIAACWGNPHLPHTLKGRLKQALLQPMIYLDTMEVSHASVNAFVREWHRVRPTLLFGHAHSLYLLAEHLREMGIDALRPKGILSTSMMLMPSERKSIEEIFGVQVIDRYGCEEVGLIGCECNRHEGMHLNIEHLYIEFIKDDGSLCAQGEPGYIVVTDLGNKAMPFIRYRVEDVGVPTSSKCSCGRGLPLMEGVTGRIADFLKKKGGSSVAGISLIENTLTRFAGFEQMQIIQYGYERFVVKIVKGVAFKPEDLKSLGEYFESVFGVGVVVESQIVERIPLEKSGKYRFSICNMR